MVYVKNDDSIDVVVSPEHKYGISLCTLRDCNGTLSSGDDLIALHVRLLSPERELSREAYLMMDDSGFACYITVHGRSDLIWNYQIFYGETARISCQKPVIPFNKLNMRNNYTKLYHETRFAIGYYVDELLHELAKPITDLSEWEYADIEGRVYTTSPIYREFIAWNVWRLAYPDDAMHEIIDGAKTFLVRTPTERAFWGRIRLFDECYSTEIRERKVIHGNEISDLEIEE